MRKINFMSRIVKFSMLVLDPLIKSITRHGPQLSL